jgi:hypothetical protein
MAKRKQHAAAQAPHALTMITNDRRNPPTGLLPSRERSLSVWLPDFPPVSSSSSPSVYPSQFSYLL